VSEARPELYSIGHSNHPVEVFVDLLRRHEVALIADVRARPYSRFVPHFSKERLARLLQEEGVGYLYLGAALGGKPVRGEAPSTAPDYASRVAEPEFQAGIERLLTAARARRTAMLCRERDPLDCHRLHLICRYAKPMVGAIHHILPDGSAEAQAATEQRLLERAGAAELPLFGSDDALERVYDRWWREAR
jgi:uncharacterized protein (DUF488 family)